MEKWFRITSFSGQAGDSPFVRNCNKRRLAISPAPRDDIDATATDSITTVLMRRRHRRPEPSPAPDAEEQVRLAFRVVLGRDADDDGLAVYAAHLRTGQDLPWLLQTLSESAEFHSSQLPPPEPRAAPRADIPQLEAAHILSHRLPMLIDASCTETELQQLWDHVASTWSALGASEPHWSVLTQDHFRTGTVGEVELTAFYATGDSELERLNAWLARNGLAVAPDALCAEFGCGVGRITRSLARQYGRVIALDVSVPHLRTAEARMLVEDVGNIEFVPLTGRPSLDVLRDIDVFYSIIALQHSPPPIILDVLQRAFTALRPGEYAYFQVPTYGDGYGYSVATHLERLAAGVNAQGSAALEMEVHFVPQHTILELAHRHGLRTVKVQPDTSAGNLDRWISNTFLLTRD